MLTLVVILSRPVLLNTVGKLNNALGFEIRDYRERIASTDYSSLGRYVFGSEISYNKPPPRLPGLAY
jgi:hypothetical protein